LPYFSVIIPSYNRAAFIPETLRSVFAQEFKDFEVIVVDDGSTDDTVERIEQYRRQIKFLQQANRGPGAARNLGVQQAQGQYIAFLDSDDLWFPWTLAVYAEIIQNRGNPILVAGKLAYFHRDDELDAVRREQLRLEDFPDYYSASQRGLYCGTCQMVVKREAILETGGFAEAKINAEDHDLVMRLGTAQGFVSVNAPAMIAYRQHVATATRDLSKTFLGLVHLLNMEQSGRYPGGDTRRSERRRILTHHVRPLTMNLLRQRDYQRAWTLYTQTFTWNFALGRFRYLGGFFLGCAASLFRRSSVSGGS
jgi:glycosyltransferase involved in cell wall biosynthesis